MSPSDVVSAAEQVAQIVFASSLLGLGVGGLFGFSVAVLLFGGSCDSR